VAIILDGNRRYAEKRGILEPHQIYAVGANKLDDVLDWCAELGIRVVTLWVLSTENLRRRTEDVGGILSALESKLRSIVENPQIHQRKVRIRALGRLSLLPDSILSAIKAAEAATRDYDTITVVIAVAYGGREEICDAIRRILREAIEAGTIGAATAETITPDVIGKYLYFGDFPEPDLIIRTSGELRLSGFLLWQSAYSELYFTDVNWPEFRKIDFLRAIRSYQRRGRRFGQ